MAQNLIKRVCLSGNRGQAIDNLRYAAQNDGCFYIANSPFSEIQQTRQNCLKQLDTFYKQNLECKKSVGQGFQRGYFKIGDESGSVDLIEKKESFTYGYQQDLIPESFFQQSQLAQINLFPQEFSQKEFQTMLEKMNETAIQLVDLCSEAFETNFNDTVDITSKYQSFIKSFRYYGKEQSDQTQTTGNSLHSDWNLLTLVWADHEGLELLRDDYSYTKIHPENQNDLICNFGDFMASLTGGKVRSPWHLVKQPDVGTERNSLILFFYPRNDFEAQKNVISHQGKPLGLFVDQSKEQGTLWDIPKNVDTMGQMYGQKWKQISRNEY